MIENFSYKNKQIAIVVRSNFKYDGAKFFTGENLPQQVGILSYSKEHNIPAHLHNNKDRVISSFQETLIIRKGKLKLDLYSDDKKFIESITLNQGDIAILISGGHGFKCLEDCEIIEIKQGPHLPEEDKNYIDEGKYAEI